MEGQYPQQGMMQGGYEQAGPGMGPMGGYEQGGPGMGGFAGGHGYGGFGGPMGGMERIFPAVKLRGLPFDVTEDDIRMFLVRKR